jgi:hypothetical protein
MENQHKFFGPIIKINDHNLNQVQIQNCLFNRIAKPLECELVLGIINVVQHLGNIINKIFDMYVGISTRTK